MCALQLQIGPLIDLQIHTRR